MAIMMRYEWKDATPEHYDAVRDRADWLGRPPAGGRVHLAAFNEAGLQIIDVWDSVEELQAFLNDRIAPAIAEVGIPGEPVVEIIPLHESYCPVPATLLATPVSA